MAGELIYNRDTNTIEGKGYNGSIDCKFSLDNSIAKSKLSKRDIKIVVYKDSKEYQYIGKVGEIQFTYSGAGGWGKPIESAYCMDGDRYTIMDNNSNRYLCGGRWQTEPCCYSLPDDFQLNRRETEESDTSTTPDDEPEDVDKNRICSSKSSKIVCAIITVLLVAIVVANLPQGEKIPYTEQNSTETEPPSQDIEANSSRHPPRERCSEYQKSTGLCSEDKQERRE